jgi:hypothetical protein
MCVLVCVCEYMCVGVSLCGGVSVYLCVRVHVCGCKMSKITMLRLLHDLFWKNQMRLLLIDNNK